MISADEGVVIFDGQTGSRLDVIEGEQYNGSTTLRGVTVVPGGRLITASLQGELTVYDLENARGDQYPGVVHAASAKVATSDDGSLAVATGQDHSVTLYDVDSGGADRGSAHHPRRRDRCERTSTGRQGVGNSVEASIKRSWSGISTLRLG